MTYNEYRTFRLIQRYYHIVKRNPSAWLRGLTVTERVKYRFPELWPDAQRSAGSSDCTMHNLTAGALVPAA